MHSEPLSGGPVSARPIPAVRTVYALVDPRDDTVRYVGVTTLPLRRRLATHLTPRSLSFQSARTTWLESLIAEGLRPVVRAIETVTGDGWMDAERRWIAYYGDRLTNVAKGGHGTSGARYSDESRARISRALKGKTKSAEHRHHLSVSARNRKVIS